MPLADPLELLLPAAEDPPCGPNLEYSVERLQLERALAGQPERQAGDIDIAAVPPDWPAVASLAERQLRLSKDLRVAVAWTRAATRLQGLPGCAAGLGLVLALLQRYGAALHPADDDEDEPRWAQRLCLQALGHEDGLPADLLAAPPVEHADVEAGRAIDLVDAIEDHFRQDLGLEAPDLSLLRQRLAILPPPGGSPGAPVAPSPQGERIAADIADARHTLQAALAWIDASG